MQRCGAFTRSARLDFHDKNSLKTGSVVSETGNEQLREYSEVTMTWMADYQKSEPEFPQNFSSRFLQLFLFHIDVEPRVRGVHRLGQLDSRHCFQSSCSQIACNFIFVCKYVFLVRCVAASRKNRHAGSSDKQLHHDLFGERQVWDERWSAGGATVAYSRDGEENGRRENTGETSTNTTRGLIVF